MQTVAAFLVKYPELAVYLTIAAGYLIGRIRVGRISFGPVTGSLFAGLLIGQLADIPIAPMAKSILFVLFLFGIGYSVGPQFMQSLKRDGLKPMLLAVVVCVTGLLGATAMAKLLRLDPGYAAGLLSGALTESPAIGTATEAISHLPLPEAQRQLYASHVAVADAVCYLFGVIIVIVFLTEVAPRLMKIDLHAEALELERKYGIQRSRANLFSAWRRFEMRAYRLGADSPAAGAPVSAAEERGARHARLFVQRVRRGDEIIEADPTFVLQPGDVVAVSGPRDTLVSLLGDGPQEVEDQLLLDVPVATVDVLLTNRDLAGRTLEQLAQGEWTRSLYLRAITRGGEKLPLAPGITLERGDIVHLVGPETIIERAASRIGPIIAPTTDTDFVSLGLAIFLGGLVGVLVAVPIGDTRISLSSSVGVLLAGLAVGHLRTRFPLFGRIPDGAINLMTSLGLAAFVGMVGLHAGPIFFPALAEAGLGLLFGGMVVTATPMVVGLLFGRFVLRMNPVLLLGALAGSQTMTAGMAAVQARSGSPVAVLGYTPAYPLGHILLTTWGTVIVGLMA
ncbi:MAG TPA: aspartate-alanine antiporter [Acetobacteraceae bacterium]|nr:aspartate-alanine antiporter [Acetobacteraceae bacterium]